MKLLFKLYLLGQLIAMPFMVGAIGDMIGPSDSPSLNPNLQVHANSPTVIDRTLCDALSGPAKNNIQDDIQQLKFITAELYGEDVIEDCITNATP